MTDFANSLINAMLLKFGKHIRQVTRRTIPLGVVVNITWCRGFNGPTSIIVRENYIIETCGYFEDSIIVQHKNIRRFIEDVLDH